VKLPDSKIVAPNIELPQVTWKVPEITYDVKLPESKIVAPEVKREVR
jgi:hypothetical protein